MAELTAEQIRRTIDIPNLESTKDVENLEHIIGQERAQEALKIGLGVDQPGYHIFVSGAAGSGKETTTLSMAKEEYSQKKISLNDIAFVNNFQSPDSPKVLKLPQGYGKILNNELEKTLKSLSDDIIANLTSEPYKNKKNELNDELDLQIFPELEKMGAMISQDKKLYDYLNSLDDGLIKDIEEKGYLKKDENWDQKKGIIDSKEMDKIESQANKIYETHNKNMDLMEQNETDHINKAITSSFQKLKSKLKGGTIPKLENYLLEVEKNIKENPEPFLPADPSKKNMMMIPGLGAVEVNSDSEGVPKEYSVHTLVNKSEIDIINETDPSFSRLFGTIEKTMTSRGGFTTDFTQIKPGSIHKADCLILNALDVLKQPGVYEKLMKTISSGESTIQSSPYSFLDSGMQPEPIKTDIKLIFMGEPWIYQLLYHNDPVFREQFGIKADFENEIKLEDSVIQDYTKFIAQTARENNLNDLDNSGVAAIIESTLRKNDSQKKASLVFRNMVSLMFESDYWSKESGNKTTTVEDVDKALEAKIYRSSRIDEKLKEFILDGTIMIDTTEKVVGQVNGLAVMDFGDYMIGKPSRITAVTSIGSKGIINIDAESDQSGNIHNKGFGILKGYLQSVFAQDKPMSLNASLTFEQNYGGIDGDSASSTEIYAMLSSLSGVPIKQGIAVTGSVNQRGQIQPIGGVNEKIEGYFDICKSLDEGLTSEQGVLIPYQNVKHLMLRKDIVKAVEEKKFHIYTAQTIQEGIEVLTGEKAGDLKTRGTIFCKTNAKIDNMNKTIIKYLKSMKD